jgi:anti-sigma-K factor RskA
VTVQEYIQSGAIENCVLGMANTEEARELEEMRSLHPEVNDAFVQFETSLEQQCLQAAIAPPTDLKNKLMATVLGEGRKEEARVVPLTATHKPFWKQYAAAAAIAILLGSVAINFMMMGRVKKMNDQIAELKENNGKNDSKYAFLTDPEITPVAMYGTGTHSICRCSLYWDKKTKKAYIQIHHLAEQPDDKDYQLWALVDGKPVSAGIFRPGDKSKPIEMNNIPEGASVFAVTLEKKGGSAAPTLEQMYLKGDIST